LEPKKRKRWVRKMICPDRPPCKGRLPRQKKKDFERHSSHEEKALVDDQQQNNAVAS